MLHQTLYAQGKEIFLNYLEAIYFPSVKFPTDLQNEFLSALKTLDAKQFLKFWQVHIQILSKFFLFFGCFIYFHI